MPIHRMVSPPLSPCPPQAGSWCSRLERRPYVRLIVLGNEPRHANGLGPRIPKLPSEFDLCTNESHPLTRSSPCEAPRAVSQRNESQGIPESGLFMIHVLRRVKEAAGMALSEDLRTRVVEAVVVAGLSRNAAAKRFGVSIASAVRWLQRFQAT